MVIWSPKSVKSVISYYLLQHLSEGNSLNYRKAYPREAHTRGNGIDDNGGSRTSRTFWTGTGGGMGRKNVPTSLYRALKKAPR